jgi:uncharacterized protein with von Willebrand factor type A (vWA) domain
MAGQLADNIVHFGRALRAAGVPVGPASIIDAIRAVEVAGVSRREDVYWSLHSVLATRREHRAVFDLLFDLIWQGRNEGFVSDPDDEAPKESPRHRPGAARAAQAFGQRPREAADETPLEFDARATSSQAERLWRRDFAQMSAAEIDDARRQVARLRLPQDRIPTRRFSPSAERNRFDPRRTLRMSLRNGGELILPRYRRRQEKPAPLVAILDVSGSMSQYSRILLHFLHALSRQRRVSTFVFGTRLTNITRALQLRDPDEALASASDLVADWSGGTRIAAAIDRFNRLWSRRVLGQGATVLLVTDGLERDRIEELGPAMDRLHRSCRRLIWLNPLLRFDAFEPRAAGIRAMLPHVDDFRPIHSLETMEELCRSLSADAAGKGRHKVAA